MPEVKIPQVKNLKVTASQVVVSGEKVDVTKISFEADVSPGEIARMLYFQRRRQQLDVVVKAPQAEMDLTITPVNVVTGEIPNR